MANERAGYYPIGLQIKGLRCLIVGGGVVAKRKLEGLLSAGADCITVISPTITDSLKSIATSFGVTLIERAYEAGDVLGYRLVFVTTDDPSLNQEVLADASAHNCLVNLADDADAGDFIVPSTIRRGDLLLSVTTSGASPALAAHIRHSLDQHYDKRYEVALRNLRKLRSLVRKEVADIVLRRSLLRLAAMEVASVLEERTETENEEQAHWEKAEVWLDRLMALHEVQHRAK